MEASVTALIHQNSEECYIFHRQHSWDWGSGVEMGVAPLTITPSEPLVKRLLPILETLDSAGPEVLHNKEEMLLLEEKAMAPLNWKLTAS